MTLNLNREKNSVSTVNLWQRLHAGRADLWTCESCISCIDWLVFTDKPSITNPGFFSGKKKVFSRREFGLFCLNCFRNVRKAPLSSALHVSERPQEAPGHVCFSIDAELCGVTCSQASMVHLLPRKPRAHAQ